MFIIDGALSEIALAHHVLFPKEPMMERDRGRSGSEGGPADHVLVGNPEHDSTMKLSPLY